MTDKRIDVQPAPLSEPTDPRIAEMRNYWVQDNGQPLDWSTYGNAERGVKAMKDMVYVLTALSILQQRVAEAEAKSKIDEDGYDDMLNQAAKLAERLEQVTAERDAQVHESQRLLRDRDAFWISLEAAEATIDRVLDALEAVEKAQQDDMPPEVDAAIRQRVSAALASLLSSSSAVSRTAERQD